MTRTRLLAFLLTLILPHAQAETQQLGRLFFDPQQRAKLDFQRQRNPGFLPSTMESEGSLTINGEVRSSNGRRTRWINGEANWDGSATVPPVPVGDSFNQATGEHERLLREGSIKIKPGGR